MTSGAFARLINTYYDKHYVCTNHECESRDLDPESGLADYTWACRACGEAVRVEIISDSDRKIYVTRNQAKNLVKGDMIYLDNNFSRSYLVLDSKKGEGERNGRKWQLKLQDFGGRYFAPDQYLNCV